MKIKSKPEDFKVVEVLKDGFLKKNRGKFKVYKLEKIGMETEVALRKVASFSKVPLRLISYGGLKDKNAVTVQHICVPSKFSLREVETKSLKLSFCGFSNFPVSSATIKENFFEIIVRNGNLKIERVDVLRKVGVPNYYGEQRFTSVRGGRFLAEFLSLNDYKGAIFYLFTPAGWENSKDRRGKKLFISGKFKESLTYFKSWRRKVISHLLKFPDDFKGAFSYVPLKEIEFQFNVYQSFLFNALLSQKIEKSSVPVVSFKYKLGFLHYPLSVLELDEKIPIFTPYEAKFYGDLVSLSFDSKWYKYFHKFKRETFVKPSDFSFEKFNNEYLLKFSLPPGSYATNVLRFLFDAVQRKN